jgi:hypothetical protein
VELSLWGRLGAHGGARASPSKRASTLQEPDAAGTGFRAWTEAQGLLLVPPEDEKAA